MSLSQTLQAFEALDSAYASGDTVARLLAPYPNASVTVTQIRGANGSTDFVRVVIPGAQASAPAGRRLRWASSGAWAASARGPAAWAWCPTAMAPWRPWPPR